MSETFNINLETETRHHPSISLTNSQTCRRLQESDSGKSQCEVRKPNFKTMSWPRERIETTVLAKDI